MQTVLYVCPSGVCLLTGKSTKNKTVVKKARLTSLPVGAVANGEVIDRNAVREVFLALKNDGLIPESGVRLVVGGAKVSHRLVFAPRLKNRRMREFLKSELSSTENGGRTVCDYSVLEKLNDEGGKTLLACSCDYAFLREWREFLSECGVRINSITSTLAANAELFPTLAPLKDSTFVLCQANAEIVELTLFVKGKYRFFTTNRLSCGRDSAELADDVISMLSLINQFNKSQKNGSDIKKVLLCGFSQKETADIAAQKGTLGIEIENINSLSPLFELERGVSLDGCMNALGGLFTNEEKQLDLLKELNLSEFLQKNNSLRRKLMLLAPAAATLGVCLILSLLSVAYLQSSKNELQKANDELSGLSRSPVYLHAEEMVSHLTALDRISAVFSNADEAFTLPSVFLPQNSKAAEVETLLPQGVNLLSCTVTNDGLTLSLASENTEQIFSACDTLENWELIKSLRLDSFSQAQNGEDEKASYLFEVSLTFDGENENGEG